MLRLIVLTLWMTIVLSEPPKPRMNRTDCRIRDDTTQNPRNRSVDIFNWCVITSLEDATFEEAKTRCTEYPYGRLLVVNHFVSEGAFKKIIKDKWKTNWKFWVLWTTKKEDYPYPLFNKNGPEEGDPKKTYAYACSYLLADVGLKKGDCQRLEYQLGDFYRSYWIGSYCYFSSWPETKKTWTEAQSECTMFENGRLAVIDTRARRDELQRTLATVWDVSDREYLVGSSYEYHSQPTFNKHGDFGEAKERRLAYICQYEYPVCNSMEPCMWKLRTGVVVRLCGCKKGYSCIALPHLGPGMLPNQRDCLGKVIGTLNFYMAYRSNEVNDEGLVIATCQHNVH